MHLLPDSNYGRRWAFAAIYLTVLVLIVCLESASDWGEDRV
jgi:hypothetical protein